MDLETYKTVIRPRIDGTWKLHNALRHADLDFFVLFSSICGIVGYYRQANYAASNSFLDAFVQYRHDHDLPASVMDIEAIGTWDTSVARLQRDTTRRARKQLCILSHSIYKHIVLYCLVYKISSTHLKSCLSPRLFQTQ